MKIKKRFTKLTINFLVWAIAIIHIYPIFLVLISALKSKKELSTNPIGLPKQLVFENFVNAFQKMDYFRSFFNTTLITAVSVIFIIFISSAAAYAISRKNTGFYNKLYLFFLASLIIPFQMTMIPLFKLMTTFSLINTYHGIILINLGSLCPFAIFLFTGFIKTVPLELEEAALVDGCGVYKTFFLIVFPLLRPAIATVAVLQSFGIWNDFLMPMLFLPKKEMRMLVPQLASFVGQYFNDWSSIFACIFLIIYPMLFLYILAQKSITSGITAGAVKG